MLRTWSRLRSAVIRSAQTVDQKKKIKLDIEMDATISSLS